MVLLVVVAIIALLSALLTEWAFSTLVDMRLTETFRDSTRAYYLAKGGIEVGRQLLEDDRNGYDAPDEIWAMGVPSYPVGEAGVISIAIEDQDGRLDLNRIVDAAGVNVIPQYRDRLARLLENLGTDNDLELVDALLDWLDKDDDPSGLGGAETAYYQTLAAPYPAKNGRLDTLDELLLVKGFTPEVVQQLSPWVTVHGGAALNLNTAGSEVILSWEQGLTAAAVDDLLAARQSGPFKTLDEVKTAVGVNMYAILNLHPGDIGLSSRNYSIRCLATVNDGARRSEGWVEKMNGSTTLQFFKVN